MDGSVWQSFVSARVRLAIAESKYSNSKVADLSGIPRTTLKRRIDCVDPFKLDELEALGKTLGIDPLWFLDGQRRRVAS